MCPLNKSAIYNTMFEQQFDDLDALDAKVLQTSQV